MAKLARPQLPRSYVDRPRLRDALDVGTERLVTLVTGGPGWGKTLLVASWAADASSTRTVVWLTLDADDDNPRVFWTYLLAALRASGAVPPGSALASLDPVGGLTPDAHRRIQVGLSQLSHEVVLVLDDVFEVRSPEMHHDIARLFRHESPLRIVLVSRVEAPLPLQRLRVGGDVAEIMAEDLAFTAVEAAELLQRQGLRLDEREVAELLQRTEGWAAGLRFAAMFLHRSGVRPADFGASDRAVAQYLREEVVAGQWPFLLRTSVVSRVCGELADALTGEGNGQATLDRLEGENAFVTALGPDRHWHRYHPLLREMLRRQLDIEQPGAVPRLHEQAARWFAANSGPLEALRHAVAARDWQLTGSLFTNVAFNRMQTTDRRALAEALAQIPTAELGRSAELQLCAAGLLMVQGRYADIAPHLILARTMVEEDPQSADPSTRIALSLLEAAVARVRGSATRVVAAASEALQSLEQHGLTVPLSQEYRAIALNLRGVGLLWQGRTEEATASLQAGHEACLAADVELTLVNDLGHLGLAAAAEGRLREATDWGARCLALAEARGWAGLLQVAAGYLTLALVSTERNDLAEADRLLALGLQTQRGTPEPLMLCALRLAQVAVDLARGRYEKVPATLEEVRDALDPRDGQTLIHRWLTWNEAEVELAGGSGAGVRARLESVPAADRSYGETLLLARARLAEGEAQGLDQLLAPVVRQRQDLHLAVQASVVQALAADRLRMDSKALEALGRGLADAEPEQMLSPFVGLRVGSLQGLLERIVLLGSPQSDFARALLAILDPVDTTSVRRVGEETVTERERAVLRYLATMLSNAEIAELMYLSPNTVKVHLQHVYRKLGVSSRRAAVRRARDLGLLRDAADVDALQRYRDAP
jgi:LuxR family maltose regulon positive regulatory protein